MQLRSVWRGGSVPFEGDVELTLRALPADAVVQGVRVRLTPRSALANPSFGERFVFGAPPLETDLAAADWGVAVRPAGGGLEIDLGTRRTVTRVLGVGLKDATVAADLGGIFVDLSERGTVLVPGDAKLKLPADGVLPAVTTRTLRLLPTVPGARVDAVAVRSAPTAVSVRFGDLAPFWSRPGELTVATTSQDVSAVLAAFLARAPVAAGVAGVPLVVHSDALCRLEVAVDVDFLRRADALPDGLPEVALSFGVAGSSVGGAPLRLRLPAGARVAAGHTTGSATGSFEPTRLAPLDPAVTAAGAVDTLPLAGSGMVATPVVLTEATSVTAVDLRVAAVTTEAAVELLVRADDGGKPLGADLLPRPVPVKLTRAAQSGLTWVTVALPAPLHVPTAVVWLIAQCRSGEAVWATGSSAGPGTAFVSADGGFSWRIPDTPAVAAFRMRWVPDGFRMPLGLRVGPGDGTDVPLARFEPLGRVELDLGLPELGTAVTTAASAAAPCPVGELLADGAFHDWTSVGRALGDPAAVPTVGDATALAVSADGGTAYIGTSTVVNDVELAAVAVVDLGCGEAVPSFPIPGSVLASAVAGPSSVTVVAAHPDGRTLYAGVGATLVLLDASTGSCRGVPMAGGVVGLAPSPDGSLLFVALDLAPGNGAVPVAAYDPDALMQAALTGADAAGAIRNTLSMTDTLRPIRLAVAGSGRASGAVVAVLCADSEAGPTTGPTMLLADAALHPVGSPVQLTGGIGAGVALNAAGTAVVAVVAVVGEAAATSGRLDVIDAGSALVTGSAPLDGTPIAVAMDPDEPIAYAALSVGDVVPLDLGSTPTARPAAQVDVGAVVGLAVLGDGYAVCLASHPVADPEPRLIGRHDRAVTVIPVGAPVPREWSVVSGTARPVCVPGYGRAASLGGPATTGAGPRAGVVAQVVPVRGGCPVSLTFDANADATLPGPACVAEVRWLGPSCASGRIDVVAIQESVPPRVAVTRRGIGADVSLLAHGSRIVAPDDATQAEVRFVVPVGRTATVGHVSFGGIAGVLDDTSLLRAVSGTDGSRSAWTTAAGTTPRLSAVAGGVRIVADGPRDGVLEQVISVPSGASLTLRLHGMLMSGSAPARAEVVWEAAPATEPALVVRLGAGDMDLVMGYAQVPDSVATARVRLVVPMGSAVELAELDVATEVLQDVELRFTAQAPGELSVRDTTARYDVVSAPAPAPPPGGLCPPSTADGRRPVGGTAYCCACGHSGAPQAARAAVTPSGRLVTAGVCPVCAAELVTHHVPSPALTRDASPGLAFSHRSVPVMGGPG